MKGSPEPPTEEDRRAVAEAVLHEFRSKPPTVAVVGLSGTGKSSTINALFGQKLRVSHTVRGTAGFERVELQAVASDKKYGALPLVFMDAPGLGEDQARDPGYLTEYEHHLAECDVILWVLAARNRALALDQQYLQHFQQYAGRIVLGINQSDLVHPNDWDSRVNLPSGEQLAHIEEILEDRRTRMSKVLGDRSLTAVAYSASKRWKLIDLLNGVMSACDTERSFMFSLLSHLKPTDFLPSTLTAKDKRRIKKEMEREISESQGSSSSNLSALLRGRWRDGR